MACGGDETRPKVTGPGTHATPPTRRRQRRHGGPSVRLAAARDGDDQRAAAGGAQPPDHHRVRGRRPLRRRTSPRDWTTPRRPWGRWPAAGSGRPVDRQPRDRRHDAGRAAAQGVHLPGAAERLRRPEGRRHRRRDDGQQPWARLRPGERARRAGGGAGCRPAGDRHRRGRGAGVQAVDRDQPRSARGVPRRDRGDGRAADLELERDRQPGRGGDRPRRRQRGAGRCGQGGPRPGGHGRRRPALRQRPADLPDRDPAQPRRRPGRRRRRRRRRPARARGPRWRLPRVGVRRLRSRQLPVLRLQRWPDGGDRRARAHRRRPARDEPAVGAGPDRQRTADGAHRCGGERGQRPLGLASRVRRARSTDSQSPTGR